MNMKKRASLRMRIMHALTKTHVENLRSMRLIMYSKHVPPNPSRMTSPSHNNRAEHGKSQRKNFISYSIKYTVYYEKWPSKRIKNILNNQLYTYLRNCTYFKYTHGLKKYCNDLKHAFKMFITHSCIWIPNQSIPYMEIIYMKPTVTALSVSSSGTA